MLLAFMLDVLHLPVGIAYNQHVEILKILSLYMQPCKQKEVTFY